MSTEERIDYPFDDEPLLYELRLTPQEMKVTHTALITLRDDLGHEEVDVRRYVQAVLDKLPGVHDMRAISLESPKHER